MIEWYENDRDTDPKLQTTHKTFEMTPQEKQEAWFKKLNYLYFRSAESRQKYFFERPAGTFHWSFLHLT